MSTHMAVETAAYTAASSNYDNSYQLCTRTVVYHRCEALKQLSVCCWSSVSMSTFIRLEVVNKSVSLFVAGTVGICYVGHYSIAIETFYVFMWCKVDIFLFKHLFKTSVGRLANMFQMSLLCVSLSTL